MDIDTSPAALRKLSDEYLGDYEETKVMRDTLLAAEKEAQQPVADVPVHPREGPLWANVRPRTATTDLPSYPTLPLYLAPQHHPEQPLEMVAPAEVPLPEPMWPRGFFGSLPLGAYSADQTLAHREAYVKAAVAAERERWTQAVILELDNNGQAEAIVLAAQKGTV